MEATLKVLNELEREGVITRYAIGGAVGAIFYMEPFLTYDVDVFVLLPQTAGGLLTLTPIYEALRKRGCPEEGECILIEGMPVQFLPAYNALLEEALAEARETRYAETLTRVLRPDTSPRSWCRPRGIRTGSASPLSCWKRNWNLAIFVVCSTATNLPSDSIHGRARTETTAGRQTAASPTSGAAAH